MMTSDEKIKIIQALKNGKKIVQSIKNDNNYLSISTWEDYDFNFDRYDYKVDEE